MKQIPLHVAVWFGTVLIMFLSGLGTLLGYAWELSQFFFTVCYIVFVCAAVICVLMSWIYGYLPVSFARREFRYALSFVTVTGVIAFLVMYILSFRGFSWSSVFPGVVFVTQVLVVIVLLWRQIRDAVQ